MLLATSFNSLLRANMTMAALAVRRGAGVWAGRPLSNKERLEDDTRSARMSRSWSVERSPEEDAQVESESEE